MKPGGLAARLKVGILAGMSLVLMLSLQVPLLPAAPFLRYDLSEVPALIAGFSLGPAHGVAVILLKNGLFLLQRLSPWELVGVPMNTLAGLTLVWVSASVYWRRKSRGRAALALALGTLAMALVMIPANLFLYPLFTSWILGEALDPAKLRGLVLVAVTPFNLIKGTLSGLVTFAVYKRVSSVLRRWAP